ncbi:amino acid adenylation domain-containing protein, partial [Rhodococcus ruber]|uniref:amino acid adenylation domain-containing protein n=1 Tax=Rhodococcus ruber TaxID=1830 RepID=UPI00345B9E36
MVSVAERFVRVLGAVAADPDVVVGDVEVLDAAERAGVVGVRRESVRGVDAAATVVSLFEARVARAPEAPALVSGAGVLSYGQFAARVRVLARRLIAVGVGPETSVALVMRRSPELVVAMYAVLAAGGAYVPVDPDLPGERVRFVLETAAPVCVVVAAGDAVPGRWPVVSVESVWGDPGPGAGPVVEGERRGRLRPDGAAYVLFTSGSTGRPKGVAVSHRAVVNQVLWLAERFGIGPGDAVLLKTPASFDVSVWELFATLVAGARLVVAAPDGHRDPAYLAQVIEEQSVTMVSFVPSMLGPFVSALGSGGCRSLRAVLVAGEALPPSVAARVHAALPQAQVHNLYGPTEFTVHATASRVVPGRPVTIGGPVWNSGVAVLDSRLHPVPAGVVGELYLSGVQLARGYVGRPDLTAERFVADPWGSGERMYRTGDLVRWTRGPRPELVYVGRVDFQVKFRGQRIELGEIESLLLADPAVRSAVARVVETEMGQQLVAYVVPAGGAGVDEARLRSGLGEVLPSYMVPAAFVVLDELPVNVSGKVDRKALPAPVFRVREYRAPVTPVEEIVAGVFAEVLGLERVGVDDDFFALGGNSLVATQVVARLGAALDARVPVRVMFEAATVGALAARLESHAGEGGRVVLGPRSRPERVPLSLAQSRMWFLNRFDPTSAA